MKKLFLGFILLNALSGCVTQYHGQNLSSRLNDTDDIAQTYAVNEKWWEVYQDEQLNHFVTLALQNNIDYALTAIKVNKVLYQANLLGADLVPSFSGNATASVRKNVKTGDTSVRSFSGEIGMSYELDLWQRLADSLSAQEWEYKATIEDRNTARQALMNSVVDGYYNLVYLHHAIAAAEESARGYEKIQYLTRLKHEVGKIESIEYTQASQSLLAAQNSLLDLRNQQQLAKQVLRNLLNLKPSDILEIAYPNLLTLMIPKVDLNVPLSVLANRPDLRAAELRLQGSLKSLNAHEKSWYPSITLGAAISSDSDHVRTALNVPFTSGNVRINLPFLQWKTMYWNLKIAEAEFEKLKLDFEKNLTTALNEVNTYYFSYSQAMQAADNTRRKYDLDVKNSRYYATRYQQGANELSDWLIALNTEMNSRQLVLNSRYQLIQYENMIYKAMAGRYQPKVNE